MADPKQPAVMASEPWESELPQRLRHQFGEAIRETSSYLAQPFVVTALDATVPVLRFLRDEEQFDQLVDITAVDWLNGPERFELVYIVYSHARNERVRVKTRVADGQAAPSAVPVFAGANWLEREIFDLFGIPFAGHPDLRRMLLPEEWQGHPLRRDHAITLMDKEWVQAHLGIESGQ